MKKYAIDGRIQAVAAFIKSKRLLLFVLKTAKARIFKMWVSKIIFSTKSLIIFKQIGLYRLLSKFKCLYVSL